MYVSYFYGMSRLTSTSRLHSSPTASTPDVHASEQDDPCSEARETVDAATVSVAVATSRRRSRVHNDRGVEKEPATNANSSLSGADGGRRRVCAKTAGSLLSTSDALRVTVSRTDASHSVGHAVSGAHAEPQLLAPVRVVSRDATDTVHGIKDATTHIVSPADLEEVRPVCIPVNVQLCACWFLLH